LLLSKQAFISLRYFFKHVWNTDSCRNVKQLPICGLGVTVGYPEQDPSIHCLFPQRIILFFQNFIPDKPKMKPQHEQQGSASSAEPHDPRHLAVTAPPPLAPA
jgi:hypothetical protein